MMPLAMDPQETFEVSLEKDEAKPAGARPAFVFRHATRRQVKAVRKLGDEWNALVAKAKQMPDGEWAARREEIIAAAEGAIRERLASVRNIPCADGKPEIEDILTESEILTLCWRSVRNATITADEKKGSESASPSDTTSSAKGDAPTATTGPAPTQP